MGRSKSRNKTRTERPNRRLRSDPFRSDPFGASRPVGYAKLDFPATLTRRDLSSPLTFTLPPRQPSRRSYSTGSPAVSSRRPTAYRSVSSRVWTPAPVVVHSPQKPAKERETMVCVDRQQRREVLHAVRKTGQGGQKPPVRDWKSKIHCKKR